MFTLYKLKYHIGVAFALCAATAFEIDTSNLDQAKLLKEAVKIHTSLVADPQSNSSLQEMVQQSCIELIDNLDNIQAHQSELFHSFRNGGKSYNDFGRFQSCKDDDRM